MRGSAVVQGLKSLASKLHPQLPLSPKESQRLLAALTTSFRRQLDQAHPQQAELEETKQNTGNGSVAKPAAKQSHSYSAAFADKHLASVLTNPLLAKVDGTKKPILDYESARVELQKNQAKDPISLLEEYQEKGAATTPIGILCLEKFQENLRKLPEEKRHDAILKTEAGKRTWLWLWNSNLPETDAFIDDVRFVDLMVPLVISEGSESYLWKWFQMDLAVSNQNEPDNRKDHSRNRHHRYRWKSRLLRSMVKAKLADCKDKSANDALDTFFKASTLKEAAVRRGMDPFHYPLQSAAVLLVQAFDRSPESWVNTDPGRFEKLMERFHLYLGVEPGKSWAEFHCAQLSLVHPRSPSALPALKFLRNSIEQPLNDPVMYKHFRNPKNEQTMYAYYFWMLRTAEFLKSNDHTEDANWVLSLARRLFPKPAIHMEGHIKQAADRKPPRVSTRTQQEEYSIPRRMPFPSLV